MKVTVETLELYLNGRPHRPSRACSRQVRRTRRDDLASSIAQVPVCNYRSTPGTGNRHHIMSTTMRESSSETGPLSGYLCVREHRSGGGWLNCTAKLDRVSGELSWQSSEAAEKQLGEEQLAQQTVRLGPHLAAFSAADVQVGLYTFALRSVEHAVASGESVDLLFGSPSESEALEWLGELQELCAASSAPRRGAAGDAAHPVRRNGEVAEQIEPQPLPAESWRAVSMTLLRIAAAAALARWTAIALAPTIDADALTYQAWLSMAAAWVAGMALTLALAAALAAAAAASGGDVGGAEVAELHVRGEPKGVIASLRRLDQQRREWDASFVRGCAEQVLAPGLELLSVVCRPLLGQGSPRESSVVRRWRETRGGRGFALTECEARDASAPAIRGLFAALWRPFSGGGALGGRAAASVRVEPVGDGTCKVAYASEVPPSTSFVGDLLRRLILGSPDAAAQAASPLQAFRSHLDASSDGAVARGSIGGGGGTGRGPLEGWLSEWQLPHVTDAEAGVSGKPAHCWSEPPSDTFLVRAQGYCSGEKVKRPSSASSHALKAVLIVPRSAGGAALRNIGAAHPLPRRPGDPTRLIINFLVPGTPFVHFILVYELAAENDEGIDHRDLAAARQLLAKCRPPAPGALDRLKIIPQLVSGGGWVARKAVHNRPALIANALKQEVSRARVPCIELHCALRWRAAATATPTTLQPATPTPPPPAGDIWRGLRGGSHRLGGAGDGEDDPRHCEAHLQLPRHRPRLRHRGEAGERASRENPRIRSGAPHQPGREAAACEAACA